MTRYPLCVAVLVVLSAQAPLVEPCGGTASCVRVGIPDGGQVQLGGVLQTSRFTAPDGGQPRVRVQPLSPLVSVEVVGSQSRTSTEPDVIIGGTTSRDGGQGPIVSFRTGSYEVATITTSGFNGTTTGPVNATTITGSGPTNLTGVTSLAALDAGVQSKVGGVLIGGLLAWDAGVSTHVCQFGFAAMTTGAVQVTFPRAFSALPQCPACTHRNATNSNACMVVNATPPTVTTANFAVASGGSDIIDWMCCGDL